MYSNDLIKITNSLYSMFKSLRKTAKIMQVSHMTVSRWLQNPVRKNNKLPTININTKTYKIKETIKSTILSNPLITLRKLTYLIKDTMNIKLSKELLRLAIKKYGYTKKKVKYFGVSKNMDEKIKHFLNKRTEFINDNRTFVSIDEVSFGRNGIETKGYSLKGKPLIIKKLKPRITTVSYVVACTNKKIILKHKTNGSFNTDKFYNFIKELNIEPKTVILLDNVSFHHSKIIQELVNNMNCELLFVPPYSPWYNPVEGVFSIVKRHYYQNISIEDSFEKVNESHCNSFFNKSLNCVFDI